MTDTCNSAQKANQLISDSVNGVIHYMFCHKHLRNIWVKNVLDPLTEFLRSFLNDGLENVASQVQRFQDHH